MALQIECLQLYALDADKHMNLCIMIPDTKKIIIPALFLHIQKTAGTSIIRMVAEHYGDANVCSHGDFLNKSISDLSKFSFVSGHFGYNIAGLLMRNRYSFTFLRDPVDRVLSFYYFCRSRQPSEQSIYQLAHDLDLLAFLHATLTNKEIQKSIYNSQVWMLARGGTRIDVASDELIELAMAHLDEFSHVGFTETFEEDAGVIMRALHIPSGNKPYRENITPCRPQAKDHKKSTINLINELTHLDRKLYDAAWQKRISL